MARNAHEVRLARWTERHVAENLDAVAAMMTRRSEFPSPLAARLVALATHPELRKHLEDYLDQEFSAAAVDGAIPVEVEDLVIGAGPSASTWCAVRNRTKGIKPLVLETSPRAGGSFAVSRGPSFFTNSRNRPGELNTPGSGEALNGIPGALVQPSMLSAYEYQPNNDIALAVKLALAQNARVATGMTVTEVVYSGYSARRSTVKATDNFGREYNIKAWRVLDARGLGQEKQNEGSCILTSRQFLALMDAPFPLRGMHRVAVLGAGDSGKTVIEALFGQGPTSHLSVPALDRPRIVDWYGLPDDRATCVTFAATARTRYRRIAGLLPTNFGSRASSGLRAFSQRPSPRAGYACGFVGSAVYDMVITARGFENLGETLTQQSNYIVSRPDATRLASRSGSSSSRITEPGVFRIGPAAAIPFDTADPDSASQLPENAVALWRHAPRIATFAAAVGGAA